MGDVHNQQWGRPEDMADDGANRPVFTVDQNNPGTDLVAEMAAALAAGSLIFKDTGKYFESYIPS